ncbi:MAG: hypothetical protein LBE35_07475 [Clostridiales bacterium]|jgi:hypothetical protein|nr:hypothetical protein [Clostridiales bacterium]
MKAEYDFSRGIRNPHVGKFIRDGKYTVVIEHDGYNEIVEVDTKGGKSVKAIVYTPKDREPATSFQLSRE